MGLLGSILGSSQRVQFIQNGSNTIVQFDASIKENHSRLSTPTEFPVENGDVVSDHIIVKPFSLELTGIISDTPIGNAAGLLTEAATTLTSKLLPPIGIIGAGIGAAIFKAISGSSSPSVAAYNQLLMLQATAQPFDVLTTLQRYPNMWISNLSAPRDSETGRVLLFTVSLAQLLLVSPQSVNVQIFANPAVSANQGDVGQQNSGIASAFQQGKLAGLSVSQ